MVDRHKLHTHTPGHAELVLQAIATDFAIKSSYQAKVWAHVRVRPERSFSTYDTMSLGLRTFPCEAKRSGRVGWRIWRTFERDRREMGLGAQSRASFLDCCNHVCIEFDSCDLGKTAWKPLCCKFCSLIQRWLLHPHSDQCWELTNCSRAECSTGCSCRYAVYGRGKSEVSEGAVGGSGEA